MCEQNFIGEPLDVVFLSLDIIRLGRVHFIIGVCGGSRLNDYRLWLGYRFNDGCRFRLVRLSRLNDNWFNDRCWLDNYRLDNRLDNRLNNRFDRIFGIVSPLEFMIETIRAFNKRHSGDKCGNEFLHF